MGDKKKKRMTKATKVDMLAGLTCDKKPHCGACRPKLVLSHARVACCVPFGYIGDL